MNLNIRITDEEKTIWSTEAKRAGMTLSDFIRAAVQEKISPNGEVNPQSIEEATVTPKPRKAKTLIRCPKCTRVPGIDPQNCPACTRLNSKEPITEQ